MLSVRLGDWVLMSWFMSQLMVRVMKTLPKVMDIQPIYKQPRSLKMLQPSVCYSIMCQLVSLGRDIGRWRQMPKRFSKKYLHCTRLGRGRNLMAKQRIIAITGASGGLAQDIVSSAHPVMVLSSLGRDKDKLEKMLSSCGK